MSLKQLNVFVENKKGALVEITETLASNQVNIRALSIADTEEFGILRLIVSDVDKAVIALRDANFAVMLTDVVCISCPDVAGSLAQVLDQLAERDVFIEYMYAFAHGENANVVIRPNNVNKCLHALKDCGCDIVSDIN
jgi:hypothetical protein